MAWPVCQGHQNTRLKDKSHSLLSFPLFLFQAQYTNCVKNTHHCNMNLVQRKDGVDVFDHYDLISVIKSGSMGTVSLIEKKKKEKTGNPNYNSRNLKYLPGLFHPSGRLRPNYSKATAAAESKQQAFALKTIQLTRIPDENKIHALKNEIDILQQCDHPNIVKVYDVFTIQRQISLVLELCLGGELYTRLPYSESQAKTILQQIFSAVAYLHRRKIIHRDRKEIAPFTNRTANVWHLSNSLFCFRYIMVTYSSVLQSNLKIFCFNRIWKAAQIPRNLGW